MNLTLYLAAFYNDSAVRLLGRKNGPLAMLPGPFKMLSGKHVAAQII
jgi:hypothetical protein